MLKFCMQDYKRFGVEEIDHGSYTVKGTTCIEAQINGVVPRVILSAVEFNDFFAKKSKPQPSGAKRGRKRKHEKIPDSKPDPPMEVTLIKPKAKVGRKPKSCLTRFVYEPVPEEKRFNGDVLPSKRQRKPNSKFFSDYVVPTNYSLVDEQDTDDSNYKSDSEFSTVTPIKPKVTKLSNEVKTASDGKPKVIKQKIKESVLSSIDDDPKVDTHSSVDPLDIPFGDDIVHSFLPVYNPPQIHNYKNKANQKSSNTVTPKIKEKKPKSNPVSKSKEAPKKTAPPTTGVVTQPITILSSNWKDADTTDPSQIYGKVLCMPVILTTNSQNGVINVNDVANQSLAILSKPDPRWVQIQPKPPDAPTTPATQIPVNKKTPQKSNTNNKSTKPGQKPSNDNLTKTRNRLNNTFAVQWERNKPKVLSTSKYVLVECDLKYKPAKVSDVDFNKLVRSLKSVKLPSKSWKIRIIVSPQETITEVIFTNKEEPERCVKFLRGVTGYKVTFGKAEVRLLGAPTLQTFEDIAILLEIIHTISLNSHVLEYC